MPKDRNLRDAFVFIEENINQSIKVDDVSKASGYSSPQLYRLFKRLTGDTISEYIIRRKVSKAAIDLKNSRRTIGDIAFGYGFESHDVFTRAFNRVYGITPYRYRQSGLKLQPIKTSSIQFNDTGDRNEQMIFCVRELQSFDVIGMECEACMWDSDGAIGRLWSDFLNQYYDIGQHISPVTMYGICENETCRGEHFRYMAAVKVNDMKKSDSGMVTRTIRKQRYFQARVPKQVSTPDAYTGIEYYAKSLGYEIDSYDQIEVYSDTFQDPESHKFKLYIPIK